MSKHDNVNETYNNGRDRFILVTPLVRLGQPTVKQIDSKYSKKIKYHTNPADANSTLYKNSHGVI